MNTLLKKEKHIVIAIDGPAGSGKSTIAKIIAKKFNFLYIDTGAMYRAITWKIIKNNYQVTNKLDLEKIINDTTINYNDKKELLIDGQLINNEIRSSEVNNKVSNVATIKEIRSFLVNQQRQLGMQFNSILDGRDIGTIVFPNANLKIFLTASIDTRANRRFLQNQLNNQNLQVSLEEIKLSIQNRDKIDSTRKIGALKQAPNAILIDNTNINLEQTIDEITKLINQVMVKDVK